MPEKHSVEDITDFLTHVGDRGLMPAATAQAMAVAVRNVFSVLEDDDRANIPLDDLDSIITRFNNKRARDFNPASLKEYGRRVRRAAELYQSWRADPSNFSVRTRASSAGRREKRVSESSTTAPSERAGSRPAELKRLQHDTVNGYQMVFPVRPGQMVTLTNIPHDLTRAEADRLAQFIGLLVSE